MADIKIDSNAFEAREHGRRPVIFLRPRPLPEPRDPIEEPVVQAAPPDLAIQIKQGMDACPSQQDVDGDAGGLRDLVGRMISGTDAKGACRPAANPGRGAVETLALWLNPPRNSAETALRQAALTQLSLLQGDESIAVFASLGAIRRFASAEFGRRPQRLAENGSPQSDGPIHLTGITVELAPPRSVITRVTGFDDRPWPDVDFTAVITDVLSSPEAATQRRTRVITCGDVPDHFDILTCSSTTDVDVDDADVAAATILGLLTVPVFAGFHFLGELIDAASSDGGGAGGQDGGGVGCAVARFAENPIPRRGRGQIGSKLLPEYHRVVVTSGGIFFGGERHLCKRRPTVRITGQTSFSIMSGQPVLRATYRAEVNETFGALRFRWSAQNGQVHNPTSSITQVTFDLGPGNPGVIQDTITLRVDDGDGALPAAATLAVRINIVEGRPGRPNPRPPRQPQ